MKLSYACPLFIALTNCSRKPRSLMMLQFKQWFPNRASPLRRRSIRHLWQGQENLLIHRALNKLPNPGTRLETHAVGFDDSLNWGETGRWLACCCD